MLETPENRLKRLRIRSWRRGIKEMDLILGTFCDAELANLDSETLDQFEALLEENDQDIYPWFTKQIKCPAKHQQILANIRDAEKFR